MARQILDGHPQLGKRAHTRHVERQTGRVHVARQRLVGVGELEGVHHLGQPIDALLVERQRLPHLARGAPAAICDDVGRHGRAALSVFLVDALNHLLAPIAARQIEIDVGPFAAFLRQEALEQQLHLDGIDRRDPEAVADGAVGGRSPALHEDVLLTAVIDDVPDNQEIAGEIELFDEIELAGDLGAGLVVIGPVPIARAHLRDVAEKGGGCFPRRHGIHRKPISQIRHRVFEPLGQRRRSRERVGTIGEQLRHRFARLEVPLRISCQPPPRGIERRMVPHAREHVEEGTLGRRGTAHVVGRHERHAKRFRQLDERRVLTLLLPQEMTLQLDAHVAAAEEPDQPIEQATDAMVPRIEHGAAREGDEPGGEAVELLERQRSFPFWRAQLHARHEAAEILVALG